MGQLDVIIPVRNESGNVNNLVKRLHNTLTNAKIKYRLIFIDDNSTDNTYRTLYRLSQKYPIEIRMKHGRRGKAFSILEGAQLAETEYVAMIDGDLQYPPEALPEMLKIASGFGVIVANRRIHHTHPVRRLISHVNRKYVGKFFLGLPCDVQSGLKIFRRDLISHLDLSQIDAWTLDMSLLQTCYHLGLQIGSVDIEFSPRTSGKSKLSIFSGSLQIGLRTIILGLGGNKIFSIPPTSPGSPLGAGMIHHRRHFVTHTRISRDHSALVTFVPWQKTALISLLAMIILSFIVSPLTTGVVLMGALTVVYFADVFFNLFLVAKSLTFPPELSFTEDQLAALTDSQLPVYSVLCPLYREARVLPQFLEAVKALDWPKDKLEVLLLLEENDTSTIEAARGANLPSYIKIFLVPESQPKTKPKACNYGLVHATGEYVVIYDAEDRPDPLQLKKAYLGFQNSPQKVACLQAKLNYYNPHHNLLTRLFTAEYSLWFDITLPGLQSINTVIPLGGTSNHFKTRVLKALHGWDAFNVTEDADLGARIFKLGYRTALIDSVTLEEANSNPGNWLRQRSRWIKGYIQTYLVHNRHPLQFVREHGIHAFIFQLVVGGKIAFMLINPFLWLATISYFALYSLVGPAIESLFPPVIFYMAVFSLVFGNFLCVYYYMVGVIKHGQWNLVKFVYLIPFYWLMVSVAAFKASIQLFFKPHYWEKTIHGLHLSSAAVSTVTPGLPWSKLKLPKFASHLTGGLLLVLATGLLNVLNFATNAYLGRYVHLTEFGLITLMGSLFGLLQVPLGALSQAVTYRSGFLLGRRQESTVNFWRYIRSRISRYSLGLTIVWLSAVPFLAGFFHSDSYWPFLLFSPFIAVSGLAAVDSGFLTGNFKFAILSGMVVTGGLVRLLLSWVFVSTGQVGLVYLAIPLAALISFFIGWGAAFFLAHRSRVEPESADSRHFPLRFFGSSIITGLSAVAFVSLDIVLAKHYLSPDQAGQYALLSLAGKMVFFAGSLFSQFITPIISRSEGAGADSRTTFHKLLGATSFAVAAVFIAIGLAGRYTAPLLFGANAQSILAYLPKYTFAMAAFTLSLCVVNFHQIKNRHIFPVISFMFVLLEWLSITLFHRSIASIVSVIFILSLVQLAVTLVTHIFAHRLDIVNRNLEDFFNLFASQVPQTISAPGSMRVLVLNWRDIRHTWGGGAEVYLHELSKRWVSAGHHVTIFCGNDGYNPRHEIIDGVHIIRRGGFFTVYLWAFFYYIFQFKNRFDIVVDSENGIPFFTPLYVKIPKFLLVHHVHQNVFRQHLPIGLSTLALLLETKLMPAIYRRQKIITVSQSSKQDLQKLFPKSDISIINPGVESEKFIQSEKTKHPSFLYLGRVRPYKNLDVAIKAFGIVLAKHPRATLTIAGWGENLHLLQNLVKKLGLEKSVTFSLKVSEAEKIRLLAESWVMLQPSSFEGWGITVIESNASGTPVIASDVIGLRDSVVSGRTGLLAPVRDVDKFAEAMDYLITHRAVLKKLSAGALDWSKQFSWSVSSDEFLAAINLSLPEANRYSLSPKFIYAEPSQ